MAESPNELFDAAGMGTQGTYIRIDKSVWLSSPPEALRDVTHDQGWRRATST